MADERPSLWSLIAAIGMIILTLPSGLFAGLFGPYWVWSYFQDGKPLDAALCGAICLALAEAFRRAVRRHDRIAAARAGRPESPSPLSHSASWFALGAVWLFSFVAFPKWGQLILKNHEGTGKGNLGSIRSALSIYYGDLEGQYPAELGSLTVAGKYMASLPASKPSNYHSDSAAVHDGTKADDGGGWLYDNVSGDANRGAVWVNCTHTDTKGTAWSAY